MVPILIKESFEKKEIIKLIIKTNERKIRNHKVKMQYQTKLN